MSAKHGGEGDNEEALSLEDAATLEEEAAKYHDPDWPPLTSGPFPRPPPYHLQLPAFTLGPSVPFTPEAPDDNPFPSPDHLARQIPKLRRAIQLKKEHNALVQELRALHLDLAPTVAPTGLTGASPSGHTSLLHQKKKQKEVP